jgi:hypothetical protein
MTARGARCERRASALFLLAFAACSSSKPNAGGMGGGAGTSTMSGTGGGSAGSGGQGGGAGGGGGSADASVTDARPPTDASDAAAPDVRGPTDAADGSAAPDASHPTVLTWTAARSDFGGDDVNSIWGTGSNDVYVGTDFGHIYHLRDGAWTSASLGSDVCVGGGWASDPQNVYAVGGCGWAALGTGALFHSAGDDTWTQVPNSPSGLYGVWGSSASDVYAVGASGAFHSRSGGPFAVESVPGTPLSVWGSGPGDVYTTETGTSINVVHSTGSGTWENSLVDASDFPWVVWGSGPSDVYAIFSPSFLSEATAFVMHRRGGATWTPEAVDPTFTELVALWGSGPDDVYIGGWHEDSLGHLAGGGFYHSAGDGHWTGVGIPAPVQQVRAIWGSSGADVYVAAFDNFYGMVLWHGHP